MNGIRSIFVTVILVSMLGGCEGRDGKSSATRNHPSTATRSSMKNAEKSPLKTKKSNPQKDLIILMAEGLIEDGGKENWLSARKILRDYIAKSPAPRIRQEAYFDVARCEMKLGRLWAAFLAVEKSFPEALEAVALRRRIAFEFGLGKALLRYGKKPIPAIMGAENPLTGWQSSTRIFTAVVYNDPRSKEAPEAFLLLGDGHAAAGDYIKAERAYRNLIRHRARAAASVIQARAALARVIVLRPYADGLPQTAIAEHKMLLREAELGDPQTAALKARVRQAKRDLRERLATERLAQARVYLKSGMADQQRAGQFMLREIVRQYNETKAASEARQALGLTATKPPGAEKKPSVIKP